MTLKYASAVDLSGAERGLRDLGNLVERSYARIESMAATIRPPEVRLPSVSGGGVGDMGGNLDALATRIEGAIARAAMPLSAFASRFAAQFDAVGGTVIALAKRIDDHMKFPLFDKSISTARQKLQSNFDDMEGRTLRFAQFADKVLGGVQYARKIQHVLGSLGSVTDMGIREMGKVKSPVLNFTSSITSITNLNHAAAAATGSVKGLGVQIAAAAGFSGVTFGAVQFFKGAIKGASDYNEALNASRAILGDNANAASALADSMASEFGTAKLPILELSTSIGGLLKGAGIAGKQLDKTINDVVRRASDFSSSRNVGVDEIGKAMLVQLSGEQSDLLKRVGVDTTETTLKQYALAAGIVKAGQEMTNQQKILARLGIVMEKTSFAQDDLRNTIDGPANAYRRLEGQIENFQLVLGTAFLPVVERALKAFNELAGATANGFDGNSPGMQGFIASLNEAVDTAAIFLRQWNTAFEIIQIQAAKMAEDIMRGAKDAPRDLVIELMDFIGQAFGDKPLRRMAPTKPSMDYDKLIAQKTMEMSDREFKRQGGAPLKPAAPPKIAPPRPIDEAAQSAAEKAFKELERFADALKDKVRRPVEEYAEYLIKANAAFKAGLITQAQFGRADMQARKEAGLDKNEYRSASTVLAGSQEAYSIIDKARYGTGQTDTSKQIVNLNKNQITELRAIRREISRQNGRPVAAVPEINI